MRRQAAWTCVALIATLTACGDDAQEEPESEPSPPVEVALGVTAEDESFAAMGQSVAALAGGDIAATWRRGPFESSSVVVQLLDSRGVPRLAAGGVTLESGALADPGVVAHVREGFFVGYSRRTRVGYEIVVHRFDRDGFPLWPGGVAAARSARSAEAQSEPFLTADASGGVYVCFAVIDWSGATPPWNLRCQRLSENGQRLWGESGRQVAPARGWRVLPRAVLDGSGGLLVFWADYGDVEDAKSVPIRMEAQRFSPDGSTLWNPAGLLVRETNLSEQNGHSYEFYDVVPDGAGGAVLAFNDWTQTADDALDVMAQRVSQEGQLLWGNGAIVAAHAGHEQHDATIATCAGCAAVTVWEPGRRLVLYMLGADGRHLWPETGIELSAGGGESYGAAGDYSNGVLRVAWTRQLEAAGSEFDVLRARFSSDGTRLAGSEAFSTAPAAQVTSDAVYQRATSSFVVAWADTRASGSLASTDTYLGIQVDRTRRAAAFPSAGQASSEARLVVSSRTGRLLAETERGLPAGHVVRMPDRSR
jgi:hypothetical protein